MAKASGHDVDVFLRLHVAICQRKHHADHSTYHHRLQHQCRAGDSPNHSQHLGHRPRGTQDSAPSIQSLTFLQCLFWMPLAQKFGRRPTFIACAVLFFGCGTYNPLRSVLALLMQVPAVWCGVATSYSSLLGARVVIGFAAAACEVLGVAIVGDIP
jgi:hypothetical protein